MSQPELPLDGVRVIDLTLAMAGPLATSRLADLGADVIKIESPQGDFSRQWPINGYRHGEDSSAFLMLNRNKRGIVLDLKRPEAHALLHRLVRSADVVVQNFRPGVAQRLGAGYAQLAEVNPALVYVSISGYGEDGPMAARPGQDLLVQSFSGLTFNAGTADGLPHPSPVYVIDTCASHLAAQAALAGYVRRLRTGRGGELKVSLLAAALEIQIQEISTFLTSGRVAARSRHPFGSAWMDAPYGIYRTADAYIAVAQARLPALAEAFGDPRLLNAAELRPGDDEEARLRRRDHIGALAAENFVKRTTAEWVEDLTARDIWVGPVLTYEELVRHPQVQSMLVDVAHPAGGYRTLAPAIEVPGAKTAVRRAPVLGEHTRAVLQEAGLTEPEAELLIAARVAQ